MKNDRPLSFFDICQPGGNGPNSSVTLLLAVAPRAGVIELAVVFERALFASISSI